jgi:hypothetical protein
MSTMYIFYLLAKVNNGVCVWGGGGKQDGWQA